MPTINRVEEPEGLLRSLAEQTFKDFELIVVDQNLDGRLDSVLGAYEEEFPILHVKLKPGGASKARNTGLERAGGDIVAFPDDDCIYPANVLHKVDSFFSENPGEDGLNGRSLDEEGNVSMARFDTEPGPVNKQNIWARGIEYTLFFKRNSLRNIRFDEQIGPASGTPWLCGEGTDLQIRMIQSGLSIYYDPSLIVIHPSTPFSANAENIRKAYSYGCGMGHVLKKHEFPLSSKVRYLLRPFGGAVLAGVSLNFSKARYYSSVFKGRFRGLR